MTDDANPAVSMADSTLQGQQVAAHWARLSLTFDGAMQALQAQGIAPGQATADDLYALDMNHMGGLAATDALALPFADGAFDVVVMQHVAMQIAEKDQLFGECVRVLTPGGGLALHEIFAGEVGPPHFPLAWATEQCITPSRRGPHSGDQQSTSLLAYAWSRRRIGLPSQTPLQRALVHEHTARHVLCAIVEARVAQALRRAPFCGDLTQSTPHGRPPQRISRLSP